MPVTADFVVEPDPKATGFSLLPLRMPIRFRDTSVSTDPVNDPVTSWTWTFASGEEAASNYQNPIRRFLTSGIKTIQLDVETLLGATDSTTVDVEILDDGTLWGQWRLTGTLALHAQPDYTQATIRTAGPVKALGERIWAFTAPDDSSVEHHRLTRWNLPFLTAETTIYFPSLLDPDFVDVTRGRMHGSKEHLLFVGDNPYLYFLTSASGPIERRSFTGAYPLKGVTKTDAYGDEPARIYVLADEGGQAILLELDSPTDSASIIDLDVSIDEGVDHLFVIPSTDPEKVGPTLAFFNGPTFIDAESPTRPTTVVTYSLETQEVSSFEVQPFGGLLVEDTVRSFFWALSSGDRRSLTKRLDDVAISELERDLAGLVVLWGDFDGNQNIWLYAVDPLLNDAYTTEFLGGETGRQPCGNALLTCYNVVLREFVSMTWLPMVLTDKGSGPELPTETESAELGSHIHGSSEFGDT